MAENNFFTTKPLPELPRLTQREQMRRGLEENLPNITITSRPETYGQDAFRYQRAMPSNPVNYSQPTSQVFTRPIPQETPAQTISQDTVNALQTGADASVSQQEFNNQQQFAKETLFGGDFGTFVGNLLQTFARPEFLQPGFAGEGLAPLAKGLSAARAGIAADEREMQKAALQALGDAKGTGGFELKGPAIELVDRITGAQQSIEAINRLKEVLSASRVSGAGPAALQALKRLGNFFGIQLDTSSKETYQQNVNKLKQAILTSGLFGREATKAEYKILEEIVGSEGLFTGDPELLAKLQGLEMSFNQKLAPAMRMLDQAGVDTKTLFAPNRTLATKD